MGKLQIHVNEKPTGVTVSKFGKAKDNDKIVFLNDHGSLGLEIRIDDATALCLPNGAPAPVPITIAAGKSDNFVICNGYNGTEFKYTAKLNGLTAEDPIIIVDKHAFLNPNPIIIVGVASLVIGLVVGYLFALWQSRRRALPAA